MNQTSSVKPSFVQAMWGEAPPSHTRPRSPHLRCAAAALTALNVKSLSQLSPDPVHIAAISGNGEKLDSAF